MNTPVTRWNSLDDMEQFENRLASLWNWESLRFNGEQSLSVSQWNLRGDLLEDEHEFVVKAELSKMKHEHVTFENSALTHAQGHRDQSQLNEFSHSPAAIFRS